MKELVKIARINETPQLYAVEFTPRILHLLDFGYRVNSIGNYEFYSHVYPFHNNINIMRSQVYLIEPLWLVLTEDHDVKGRYVIRDTFSSCGAFNDKYKVVI